MPRHNEVWCHFKDKLYRIVTIAQHTETGEQMGKLFFSVEKEKGREKGKRRGKGEYHEKVDDTQLVVENIIFNENYDLTNLYGETYNYRILPQDLPEA